MVAASVVVEIQVVLEERTVTVPSGSSSGSKSCDGVQRKTKDDTIFLNIKRHKLVNVIYYIELFIKIPRLGWVSKRLSCLFSVEVPLKPIFLKGLTQKVVEIHFHN